MRKFRKDLTAEYVRKLLIYNQDTGEFTRYHNGTRADFPSGHKYRLVKIDGKNYPAHRIAWLIQTGKWPKEEIDHHDMNRSNNRWDNLREATRGQNQSNGFAYKNNRLGLKGVSTIPTRPGKYRARIRKDGREISLGVWDSLEEAQAAYIEAAKRLHGEFWRV